MDDDRGFAELAVQQGLITQVELEVARRELQGHSLSEALQAKGVLSASQVGLLLDLLKRRHPGDSPSEPDTAWETLPDLAGRILPGIAGKPDDFLLAKIALEWKLIEPVRLVEALREQEKRGSGGRDLPLGEILVSLGLLAGADLSRILKEQSYRREGPPDLPRYEIRERAGQGASAVVYRAWDRELGRMVAIKVLREIAGMTEIARARFKREGRAEAGLSHAHLVTLHDVGEVGGRPYLVMELVEGQSLGDLMLRRPFTEAEIVVLMEKAARGVAAAHAKGIVHRDLKPQNILIAPGGEPKVGDFGLAHITQSTEQLTRTGATLGTPLYMAPEQVRGSAKDITPRTDVYALGAILYELLSGKPPHMGETLADLYRKIEEEPPATLRGRTEKVSRDLETIVRTSLEKNPLRRYADAGALADDLARYRAGEPIHARPPTPVDLLFRRAAKHRGLVASFAAVLVLAAGVAMWISSSRARLRLLEAPQVERVQGKVEWSDGTRTGIAVVGRRLLPGESLEISSEGSAAVIRYPDLSAVDLSPGSKLRRLSESEGPEGELSKGGKALFLEKGAVVIKGPAGANLPPIVVVTPQAVLELGEGEQRVRAESPSTLVEVDSGHAKVTRPLDHATVTLGPDQAVAVTNTGDLAAKPIQRSRLDSFSRAAGVDSSLVGYWKLGDGQGSEAKDSSGRSQAARVVGDARWIPSGGIRVDGKGGHVELPTVPELNRLEESGFTLSVWYRPAATPVEEFGPYTTMHGLFTKGPWKMGLFYTKAHQFVVQHYLEGFKPGDKDRWAGTGSWSDDYAPGSWHHVAAIIDRAEGQTRIFVNGRERTPNVWSQKNSLPVALSSAPWRVGALEVEKGKPAYFAQGDLAEIRVYNRALASEEVQVVYRAAPASLQK